MSLPCEHLQFIFIFSHTTLKQGLFVAERIRASIVEHPVCLNSGQKKQITVSMGIVEFSTNTAPADATMLMRGINAADDALYRAKESGRNTVCVGHIDNDASASGITCAREAEPAFRTPAAACTRK
jgi:diguanylate cyclase (GGDEF)-like protein